MVNYIINQIKTLLWNSPYKHSLLGMFLVQSICLCAVQACLLMPICEMLYYSRFQNFYLVILHCFVFVFLEHIFYWFERYGKFYMSFTKSSPCIASTTVGIAHTKIWKQAVLLHILQIQK